MEYILDKVYMYKAMVCSLMKL